MLAQPASPRFIIIANSLKDQLGHYYESSLAIAEAARDAGLRPVLAVHATCPSGMFPDWLPVFPIFRTDHWMAGPPAHLPDDGIARAPSGSSVAAQDDPATAHARARAARDPYALMLRDGRRAASARAARAARWAYALAAYYLLPPAWMGDAAEGLRPRLIQPAGWSRFARGVRRRIAVMGAGRDAGVGAGDYRTESAGTARGTRGEFAPLKVTAAPPPPEYPHLAEGLANLIDRRLVAEAHRRAVARDHIEALEHALIFKRDLEVLLAAVGLGPTDHVFLGTAHARELLAIDLLIHRLGARHAPRFHLEFRHPVFEHPPSREELLASPRVFWQRFFFELHERGPMFRSRRIRLYTDTARLSAEYRWLLNDSFGVLPIPFRNHLLDDALARRASLPAVATADSSVPSPLTLGFFGGARDEKGFHLLDALADDLMVDYLRPGRVRIAAQATFIDPGFNPRSAALLARWRKTGPPTGVELVGVDGPLSPTDYYRLVASTDIGLFPYDESRYRNASSGTLAEAIAAGIPVIVPADTWLADQVDPAGAIVFQDSSPFLQCVRRLIEEFPRYRDAARCHAAAWRARHTPARLVADLLAAR